MSRAALSCVAVAAVAVLTCGCSKAERAENRRPAPSGAAVGTGGAGADARSDGDFVRDVAIMNMAEIELSRMALDKATNPDAKAFAQMMLDEHGADGSRLKSAVSGAPIQWPAQLDEKHRKTVDELAKQQGAEFDRDYAKAMIEGHQDLAAILESRLDVQSLAEWKTAAAGRTSSKSMPNPKTEMRDVAVRPNKSDNGATMKINQWAADTYPAVQKHLDSARTLENAVKDR